MKNIRNFCIIAHIDHGKSTLADRLLEFTNTIQVTSGQMLDNMDLEKERGITIKSHAIQMEYTYQGEKYVLNLIDTPGHVDFSYEVSRSIAACEGALLIVDASQGVQAQTISNLYMAIEHDLEIIPVINKCDMASANPEEVEDEIVELLGCKREEVIRASGKTGMGVEEILAAVIERIPHPEGNEEAPLQALIFDSVFNSFRGIIAYFKIENGTIRKGDKVKFFNTGKEYDADEIGVLKMDMVPRNELRTGDVGYIISGIKTSKEVKVGDTITLTINGKDQTVMVGGVLSDSLLARAERTETLICSEETFSQLTGETGYTILDVQFRFGSDEEDVAEVEALFGEGVTFTDVLIQAQQQRGLYYAFATLVYGFLSIIVAITIFHIMNTISMGVSARTRQYGVMRAIGMSNQQLTRMISAEAASYAISGVILGCIFGLLFHWFLYSSLITRTFGNPWSVPWLELCLIIGVILATTALAVRGPARRLHAMSIVENISSQ